MRNADKQNRRADEAGFRVDRLGNRVIVGEGAIRLTPTEADIAQVLYEKFPGGASRQSIEQIIYSLRDTPCRVTFCSHMHNLRNKIEGTPLRVDLVRGDVNTYRFSVGGA